MILLSLFFMGLSLIRKLWVPKPMMWSANPTNPINRIGGERKDE
jgi:hypothetical protein